MTDTPNFYFFNKKNSSVTAFILDLSINGIFEAWKILVAEKEIILAQEYRKSSTLRNLKIANQREKRRSFHR